MTRTQLRNRLRTLPQFELRNGSCVVELPDALYAEFVSARYCPLCASAGDFTRLRYQAGDYHHYAGLECPVCEEFWQADEQSTYGDVAGPSDADPGL